MMLGNLIMIITLYFMHISSAQQADPPIKKNEKNLLTKPNTMYQVKVFHGGGIFRMLMCYFDKIVVSNKLQKHVIYWYHTTCCHPEINGTKESIGQHLYWKNSRAQITEYVQSCPKCQLSKKKVQKYG
jgi:Integrase zinc binding domain